LESRFCPASAKANLVKAATRTFSKVKLQSRLFHHLNFTIAVQQQLDIHHGLFDMLEMSPSTFDTSPMSNTHLQHTDVDLEDSNIFLDFYPDSSTKRAHQEIPSSSREKDCKTSDWLATAQISTSD
jgi:hypothetical protein